MRKVFVVQLRQNIYQEEDKDKNCVVYPTRQRLAAIESAFIKSQL